MTDVLERYRAMVETPSVLACDPTALLRDMAAEIRENRAINRDMLAALKWALTDIDAAITVVEHDRQESAHGLRQTKEKIEAAIARAEAHEGQRNNG